MATIGRLLTIVVIVLAAALIISLVYGQFVNSEYSYNSNVKYSFEKSPVSYDYSCQQNDYQLLFTIKNAGNKTVTDFSASISNPLCVGALPAIASQFNSSQTLTFFAQTTSENGTLTLSGNNTYVNIMF